MKHNIIKTEVTDLGVIIHLANGVVVNLNSNPSYIHLHFSGTEIPMTVGMAAPYNKEIESIEVPNYLNIAYKSTKEEVYGS